MRMGILVVFVGAMALLAVGASAASPKPVCTAKGATVVARSGGSLLLSQHVNDDDFYGPGTRATTCRKGERRVTLFATDSGDSVTLSHGLFTRRYVAFASSSYSSQCGKYLGDDPQCRAVGVESYNRRTGNRRAYGTGAADVLVATSAGWLAWVSPADPAGMRLLKAVDGGGERVLAMGAIDPASLRADGATVSWTAGGVAASANL